MKRNITRWLAGVICLFFFLCTGAYASTFSNILTFGDSLSDNGNADGYGITHYSNGPVWVEYLADSSHLNLPLLDLAFGGATTGVDNPYGSNINPAFTNTGLKSQVGGYLSMTSKHVETDTLITLWAGANDLFNGRSPVAAVNNMISVIRELAGAGAQNFLIMDLPDIGATPLFTSLGPSVSANATMWTMAFNTYLDASLDALETILTSDHFWAVDTFALFKNAMANPADYGFGSIADIFWFDGLHPSTAIHKIIAETAMDELAKNPVPEPSTLLLIFSGIGMFSLFRKRVAINKKVFFD